ncbi:acyl-CoA thioesterase [Desulfococcus sp.]|uniref:acyl-CoA thioesterase n=1 Tax=Desulfococcus sp. TaxID=2025834 RepID=UPI0035942A07
MLTLAATYRVIYGDTDQMGVVYYANYFRFFEMGRAAMFRHLGLSYREIEERGYVLPVSEAFCKYLASARYDDVLIIETSLDTAIRGGMKFNYTILRESDGTPLVTGHTRHACMTTEGRVVRPPGFLKDLIASHEGAAE